MEEKKKKSTLAIVAVVVIVLLAYFLPKWRLHQREKAMNEMLIEHGIMSPTGELNPPFSN